MSDPTTTPPDQCPEPFWHKTHHYCPWCTFVSEEAKMRELEAKTIAAIPAKQQEVIEEQHQRIADLESALRGREQSCAALEAELERLRCCGNCGNLTDDGDGETWWPSCGLYRRRCDDNEPWPDGRMPGFLFNEGGYEPDLAPSGNRVYVCADEPGEVRSFDPCHFTPSRWQRREG